MIKLIQGLWMDKWTSLEGDAGVHYGTSEGTLWTMYAMVDKLKLLLCKEIKHTVTK